MTALGITNTNHYNVYGTCNSNRTALSIPLDIINFFETHIVDIETMYESKAPLGDWKKLGAGISKMAFIHPELPGRLIKIPKSEHGYRGSTGEEDLRIHHARLQQIRSNAALFNRIVLPESYLYPTSKGLIIIEQKLDLLDYYGVPDSPEKEEAMNQFYKFQASANLCDLNPKSKTNAGIISSHSPIKIGVFDFDCTPMSKEKEALYLLAAIITLGTFLWMIT